MTLPTSPVTELALIRAICQGRANYQAALALGAGPEIFAPDGAHGAHWLQIASLYERDVDPMPELLAGDTSALFGGEPTTPQQTAELVKVVLGTALRRDEVFISNELRQRALRESVGVTFPWLRGKIAEIERRYTAAAHPMIGNPADTLDGLASWSTSTGVEIIDKWIRYVSGDPHFIAGDPGSGKTTLCISIASGTSAEGIPTFVITSETPPLEIQLGMLSQLQRPGLDADLMNDLRFNPTYRTERNISKVRQAWDITYAAAPLRIVQVSNGPDEVVSLLASLTGPHFVLIDHAFAIVKQSRRSFKESEHIIFYEFFQNIQRESQRGNHIPVILNHYTKAGRAKRTRGPDAQYGGAGVQAIAGSMWHLRRPGTTMADTPDGYQLVLGQYQKMRARLVVDEHGNRVDPLALDANGEIVTQRFYHNHLWRSVHSSIYEAPESIPFG